MATPPFHVRLPKSPLRVSYYVTFGNKNRHKKATKSSVSQRLGREWVSS